MQKEVIPQLFQMGSSWYDPVHQMLYVPFQSKVNSGITGDENLRGVVDPESHVLDLTKYRWGKQARPLKNH